MEIYKDKEWLQTQLSKFLSEREMAQIAKCSQTTIGKYLDKYSLRRDSRYSKIAQVGKNRNLQDIKSFADVAIKSLREKFSPTAEDIINGHLLADGDISFRHNRLSIKSKHKEYLGYLLDLMEKNNIFCSGVALNHHGGGNFTIRGKTYIQNPIWTIDTLSYDGFIAIHKKWYRDANGEDYKNGLAQNRKYIKIVPKDIEINKNTLLWWHIGDGTYYKRKDRPNTHHLSLATNGFSTEDLNFLVNKLKEKKINSRYYKEKRIYITDKVSIKIFFDIIGKCPDTISHIFGYKWPQSMVL